MPDLKPKPGSTCARLRRLMERGSLTVSDLAVLLGRPVPTIRTWKLGGEPREGYREETLRRIAKLESELDKVAEIAGRTVPLVPSSITKRERPLYLNRLCNAYFNNRKISARRSAA